MFHFPDPLKLKTKRIVFEHVYAVIHTGSVERLKELSSARREIEETINDGSIFTKVVARERSGGLSSQLEQDIQKLEKYLLLLENLIHPSKNHPWRVQWASNLKIQWTSALTASSLFSCKSQKFFQLNNLFYELTMMRFLYGAMLREQASEVMSKDLVQSVTLFRKAAGVYHSLATKVISDYDRVAPSNRPPEATTNVCSVMSLVCLAEAQAVTIRKAEEKGNTTSLLAKLHYGIVQMLDEAMIILHKANKDRKDISTGFLEFISACKALHELKSYKHFATSLKADSDTQIGTALGVLQHAENSMQKNKMPSKESWRSVLKQELETLSGLIRKYEHENNFVWNKKIPPQHELPSPEGKKIIELIPYQPQRSEQAISLKQT
ncbi:BRO1 domain-containing protein [Heracleum sosnowskyi]|uniref:BRO1 domain-containing protein n=1 Tax=Heracleum sosnowskyi TaxID=360622 RepID=A0AAD8MRM7_9APIA|nr:BRO1 domain-containing protein [Heracleum sosnowskyi]